MWMMQNFFAAATCKYFALVCGPKRKFFSRRYVSDENIEMTILVMQNFDIDFPPLTFYCITVGWNQTNASDILELKKILKKKSRRSDEKLVLAMTLI